MESQGWLLRGEGHGQMRVEGRPQWLERGEARSEEEAVTFAHGGLGGELPDLRAGAEGMGFGGVGSRGR